MKRERCIGCGLCVPSCPTAALSLVMKPGAHVPPKDMGRLYGRMYRERFGRRDVADLVVRRPIGTKQQGSRPSVPPR